MNVSYANYCANGAADGHNNLDVPERNYCDYLLACYVLGIAYHDGQSSRLYRSQCLASAQLERDYQIGDPDAYLRLLTKKYSDGVLTKFTKLYNDHFYNDQKEEIDLQFDFFQYFK